MSIYGAVYDTRDIAEDFDRIVAYDYGLQAVYVGSGYPFSSSLNLAGDCAPVNESLDSIFMGGSDGYIYRAYNEDFFSQGAPDANFEWPVIRMFNSLEPSGSITDINQHCLDVASLTSLGAVTVKSLSGLDRDPTDGTLYASQGRAGGAGGNFFSLNLAVPVETLIGDTGFDAVAGLAIDSAGNVFGSADTLSGGGNSMDRLISINKSTGAGTLIGFYGSVGPDVINAVDALAFHPKTGVLYGIGFLASGPPGEVFTIDKTTGAATHLGRLTEKGTGADADATIAGLTFDSTGRAFGSLGGGDGRIITIDLDNLEFVYAFDAAPGSVSDIVARPDVIPGANAVCVDVFEAFLPTDGDGLTRQKITILRKPGSTKPIVTREITSNSTGSIIVDQNWVSGEEPEPGDTVVIGMMSPFVDFEEVHPQRALTPTRFQADTPSGDNPDHVYEFRVFRADPGVKEPDISVPEASRKFTECDSVKFRNGIGLPRKPTVAVRYEIGWDQRESEMALRQVTVDEAVFEAPKVRS